MTEWAITLTEEEKIKIISKDFSAILEPFKDTIELIKSKPKLCNYIYRTKIEVDIETDQIDGWLTFALIPLKSLAWNLIEKYTKATWEPLLSRLSAKICDQESYCSILAYFQQNAHKVLDFLSEAKSLNFLEKFQEELDNQESSLTIQQIPTADRAKRNIYTGYIYAPLTPTDGANAVSDNNGEENGDSLFRQPETSGQDSGLQICAHIYNANHESYWTRKLMGYRAWTNALRMELKITTQETGTSYETVERHVTAMFCQGSPLHKALVEITKGVTTIMEEHAIEKEQAQRAKRYSKKKKYHYN